MYRKGIKIKQHDITDCGAACLASVCAHYGLQSLLPASASMPLQTRRGLTYWG